MKLHLEYTAGQSPIILDAVIDGSQYRAGASGATKVYQQVTQLLVALVSLDIPFTLSSTSGGQAAAVTPILPIAPITPPVSTIPVTPPITPVTPPEIPADVTK